MFAFSDTSSQVSPSTPLCHRKIVPVNPESVRFSVDSSKHIDFDPDTDPPTDKGWIVNEVAVASLIQPFFVCVT